LKSAQGSSKLCKAHGGGAQCGHEGCDKRDAGRGFCTKHGGGKRCNFKNGLIALCDKASQAGTDYCVKHGGGLRCSEPGCVVGAAGKTGFCIRHGGGRRCKKYKCKSLSIINGFCSKHGRKNQRSGKEHENSADRYKDNNISTSHDHTNPTG